MSDFDERDLVARCRRGDDRAFQELVERYKDLVYALVRRTIADPSRADDLAQEAFLRVYTGLPQFRGEARLSTWIYRIAANLCAASRARHPGREVPLDGTDEHGRPRPEPKAIDRSYTDLELRDRLEKAVARLPPQYRVLVAGHYLKEMRYEDLAAALDLPLGTVKTHLHRAKRALRMLLERD